jgi:TPP-dependent pyruvate/acetoin dehydrogenase alpha subunit
MAVSRAFNIEKISQRSAAYGIPGVTVDGNNLMEVFDAVHQASERAREGDGPTLIEAVTYRWRGHSKSDRQAYRTREEVKEWMQRDPINRFAEMLGGDKTELESLRNHAEEIIEDAVAFAEASPEPDVNTIEEGVYA